MDAIISTNQSIIHIVWMRLIERGDQGRVPVGDQLHSNERWFERHRRSADRWRAYACCRARRRAGERSRHFSHAFSQALDAKLKQLDDECRRLIVGYENEVKDRQPSLLLKRAPQKLRCFCNDFSTVNFVAKLRSWCERSSPSSIAWSSDRRSSPISTKRCRRSTASSRECGISSVRGNGS